MNNEKIRKIPRREIIRNRIIVIAALVLILGVSTYLVKDKFSNNVETNMAQEEENKIDEEQNNEPQKPELDNSGYLSLEDDENAEDAMVVMNNTEKLLKGKVAYPVRSDGKKVVYLTFDDGPSTTNTPQVLDILKENEVKATFFIQGSQLDGNDQAKEILRRTVKEGHAIGNHTYCHDYHYLYPGSVISPTNFIADIDKCSEFLKDALGKDFSTRVIRFPGGYWSWKGREQIRPVLDEKGIAFINWNTLNEDAQGKKNKTADELLQLSTTNLDKLGPNADSVVFLMHDTYNKEQTVKALQGIIDLFKSRGFEFKTIK